VDLPPERLCGACFTGNYPLAVNPDTDKHALELAAAAYRPPPVAAGAGRSAPVALALHRANGSHGEPVKR
jgi:hypothetical protein